MRRRVGLYYHRLALLVFISVLTLGLLVSTPKEASAFADLKEGNCAQCHEDGRKPEGTGETTPPTTTPPVTTPPATTPPATTPPVTPPPATTPIPDQQAPEVKPPEKESASPVLVIGHVAVILGVIYVLAIKKK